MPRRDDLKTILVIGSGPIVIGQACEFDYSGTQAVKALKEEGYRVVLVNSNPATIMTDPNLADRTYIEPITAEFVAKIIEREKPDAVLPTIGGQTALNVAIELEERGVFRQHGVELIGAGVEAIKKAEDRDRFKEAVARCGLESARSYIARSLESAEAAAAQVGFPCVLRPSRTLGGSGGAIVYGVEEFREKVIRGLEASPVGELLVEESLLGWKEIELEVMRDCADNGVIICGIENLDPMGVHTGDSVTVAPIQTLTDKEYQLLRDAALKLLNEIGVDTGGSNVQFAVCPRTGRQIVIEMNPRVSRSSALASKATGFPIARIAAKIAVGYTLDELPNDITKKTPACFEPSIDYVVVKIPRFTFEKFAGADATLGTQMKSVGEVMAIGKTFCEAMQKACRSLETGRDGLLGGVETNEGELQEVLNRLGNLTPSRVFYAARAIELGAEVAEVNRRTGFDPWFLQQFAKIVDVELRIRSAEGIKHLSADILLEAKRLGMSDARIATLVGAGEESVAKLRRTLAIRPAFHTVDTCAAEFSSSTPYLYSTYAEHSDAPPSDRKKVVILGSGPNRIGQGLEFDYCCVHAALALRDAGFEAIMVNCNPETVSTDYDTSDRLYFEPLTLEDVLEVVERERPVGVIVQYGGQTPLKLSQALKSEGVQVIGTSPDSIDDAEDREKFSCLLRKLGLLQADGGTARNEQEAYLVAERVGFPALVRPSFVLGGRAMVVVHSHQELSGYIRESVQVSFNRPVLIDRFLQDAVEIDVDAVSDGKLTLVAGIMEHIERAGVHSGDSSFMLPSQTLSAEILTEIEHATVALARELKVIGLVNIQFALAAGRVYVLEVNPRASRSIPFVSKVTGVPWAKIGARVMAGATLSELDRFGEYGKFLQYGDYQQGISAVRYIGIKVPVFPFVKFRGVDALLGPEMRSTGEVMGLDQNLGGAFSRALKGAGVPLPNGGRIFLSVRDQDKAQLLPVAKKLKQLGFKLLATKGTARHLAENGLEVDLINKVSEGAPNSVDAIRSGGVVAVINTPEGYGPMLDSMSIRRTAIERSVPLFTTVAAAAAAVTGIEQQLRGGVEGVTSIQEYLDSIQQQLTLF